jgi:diguanylate cyclase (GGDEF)-like protein
VDSTSAVPGSTTRRGGLAGVSPAMRFVGFVSVLGSGAVVASAASVSEAPSPAALVLAAVVIGLGELQFVHIRHGGQTHAFNWAEAALVAGLVLLPAWWLPIVGAAAVATAQRLLGRPAVKVLFNAASLGTAAFLATAAHQHLDLLFPGVAEWVSLGLACALFFAWNILAVATIVALSKDLPIRQVLRADLTIAALVATANSSLAIFIAIVATSEPLVLFALPPILVQLVVAYRNTREVIGERDLWVAVQDAAEELQRATSTDLPRVATETLVRLVGAKTVDLVIADGPRAERHRWTAGGIQSTTGSLGQLADDVWGRAECDRVPFWIERRTASTRQRRWLERAGSQSALVMPVEWSGNMVGVLRVGFTSSPQSMQRIESILRTVGTQVASAITSHRQTEVLRHQAEHDDLTDLPNRNLLVQHLRDRLAEPGGDPSKIAVLFFDLDGFKVVNDSLGHHVGDQLLLEATRRLRSQMRPDDVVARFGGDEFIVVCDGIGQPQDAVEVAQRLLDALLEPATEGVHVRPISASVGVACAETDADPESLLRDADAAMYDAKRIGPGSVCLFTAELRTQALNRLHLEADLREALRLDQLEVHYQPIIDLKTGQVRELEALARWNHPERGSVSPAAFISVAEASGHIRALGEFVLHRACADMRRWRDLGITGDDLRVAVNLSPLQLDAGLPTLVADALARHGLPPSCLTLEVTESALVDDPDAVASLDRLRHLGVCVALDDFGTGYSSLSALRDLPVDTLKIDRSFVSRLGQDDQLEALVQGIVSLAGALELQVVGEGVEGQGQSDLLASFGCDRAQGWLHGKPASASMTEAVLSANAGLQRTLKHVDLRATVHPLRLA